MKLPPIRYAAPKTLPEAIALLGSCDAKILAGGQSLMPILAFRLAAPELLVDLKQIDGLDQIKIDADGIRIGARVRWCDIEADARLLSAHPLLFEAIKHVAHYQIRNRGTVGGSVAHADPAAETPGIAVCCDATITALGPQGKREILARDFFVSALQTSLADDEIITEIFLPAWPPGRRWGFQEFSRRKGDFALAGVAAFYDTDSSGRTENAHVAIIGAAERPMRLTAAEAALNGRPMSHDSIQAAAEAARAAVDPPADIHAPAEYRRALVGTLLERVLTQASK